MGNTKKMAIGKNKKLGKGKKGGKRKQQDPFTRKNWYDVKAPAYLSKARRAARTCVTKTTGQKLEGDSLKGRICEFNLPDLVDKNEDQHKKIKLEIQDITGRSCLSDFHGMSMTRDKMNHLVRKRHTLVDLAVDCKTADGYVLRISVIGFTKEAKDQVKLFSYAQTAQIKKIRRKIATVLSEGVAKGGLKDLVMQLISDKLESDIKTAVNSIFPLDPVHITKVKMVKKPKVDFTKLMEIHDKVDDGGVPVEEVAVEESKNLLTASA